MSEMPKSSVQESFELINLDAVFLGDFEYRFMQSAPVVVIDTWEQMVARLVVEPTR